jgi:hypothetical protein
MNEEEAKLKYWVSKKRTICEVIREINDLIENCRFQDREDYIEKFRELVLEAFTMGKKMDAKLREYKQDWDKGFYEGNKNYKEDMQVRGNK